MLNVASITMGGTLPVTLANSFDNASGLVNCSAGTFGPFPMGTFTLCTIHFVALNVPGIVNLVFNGVNPRKTDATFGGGSVLDHGNNGSVTIGAPPTATLTPTSSTTPVGPTATPTDTPSPVPTSAPSVALALVPAFVSVTADQAFDEVAQVRAGAQQVDVAAAYLNFNLNMLNVSSISASTALPNIAQTVFDNATGTLGFAAFTLSSFPTGTFTLCTIHFVALNVPGTADLNFNGSKPRQTDVTFGGNSVLAYALNGSVVINPGSTPTSTPSASLTATPTASSTVAQTGTPTAPPAATLTPTSTATATKTSSRSPTVTPSNSPTETTTATPEPIHAPPPARRAQRRPRVRQLRQRPGRPQRPARQRPRAR